LVPAAGSLANVAAAVGNPMPTTPGELNDVLVRAIEAGLEAEVLAATWDIAHHDDCNDETIEALVDAMEGKGEPFSVTATLLVGDRFGEFSEDFHQLLAGEPAIAARAASVLARQRSIPESQMRGYASATLLAPDPRVAAIGHFILGLTSTNDDEFFDHLEAAIETGDGWVSAAAALELGRNVADDATAAAILEAALRSPNPSTARDAALELARRLAHEPELAEYFENAAADIPA
jgi:hypothetical protein